MSASLFSGGSHQALDEAVQRWPCCRLAGFGADGVTLRRLEAIADLNLRSNHSIPAFEEAIQLVSQCLDAPVGWVSIACETTEYLKAAYGLSSLGLNNRLAEERQLPLDAGLSVYVLDSDQPLVIPDTTQLSALAQRELVATYGMAAYCAVPLLTTQRQCIGVLAVMDTVPRRFSRQDVSVLAMAARWGMGEYERTLATQARLTPSSDWAMATGRSPADGVRLHLIGHLIQDLRNPLTAVLGMASMLSREIYGPLTEKQREYIDIVRRSSQTLMTQVDEIIDLGLVEPETSDLMAAPIDISRLGQPVIETLEPLAEKLSHTLELTVEPQESRWILDQRTVKQILYYGVFSLMQLSSETSTIRIHACRRGDVLALVFWVSNPWLGQGLPTAILDYMGIDVYHQNLKTAPSHAPWTAPSLPTQGLGLLLSQRLAEHHGGHLQVQGNIETGYRLVISLPPLKAPLLQPHGS